MDLERTFEYLSTIEKKGSISGAAEELYISQPSLSQFVNRLEKELEIDLFYRKKRPIQFTEAGALYYSSLKRMSLIYENTKKRLSDMSNVKTGNVAIGALNYHSISILSQVIATFKKIRPRVKINILEGSLDEIDHYLDNGDIDIAMTILPISRPNIAYSPLYNEDIYLAMNASHPIARSYPELLFQGQPIADAPVIEISRIAREPFIVLKRGKRLRSSFQELSQMLGQTPPIVLETNDVTNALVLAASGLGVTFLPDTMIESLRNNFHLAYFRLSQELAPRRVVAAYNHDFPLSLAARAILDLLEDYAKVQLEG